MDMEVVVPNPNDAITLQTLDFSFDSTASSPYITAPNSPQRFGNFYFSAPTSPTRSRPSCFLHEDHDHTRDSVSSIPFGWEAKPGIPKDKMVNSHPEDDAIDDDDDFEFEFSGQLDRASASASASADELFDGGKIKPLKPPPRLQNNPQASGQSVVSPRSPRSRFSPKKKVVQDFDPFAVALEQSTKTEQTEQDTKFPKQRGRERKNGHSGSSSGSYTRKGTRSLSPLRVSDIVFEQEERISRAPLKDTTTATTNTTTSSSSISSSSSGSYFSSLLSSISFSKGYRKWSFKDFLLFRSASEGRGTSKDPLRKYSVLSRKEDILNDVKNSSFRSSDGSIGSSRRRANLSAHELHYTANRAVSEEMKKKTFLPYKQGWLGCLGFNPGVHEIARGVGSLSRG